MDAGDRNHKVSLEAKDCLITDNLPRVGWVVQMHFLTLVIIASDSLGQRLLITGEKAFELDGANGGHDMCMP
jgi:hypothetical protein